MHKVMAWFQRHRIDVKAHLDEKNPREKPGSSWRVIVMAVSDFSDDSAKVFKKMQGLTTLTEQQYLYLHKRVSELERISGAKVPPTDLEKSAYNLDAITSGTFITECSAVQEYINGLGSFVQGSFNYLEEEEKINVIKIIGDMFVFAADKISSITVECDAQNDSSADSSHCEGFFCVYTGGLLRGCPEIRSTD